MQVVKVKAAARVAAAMVVAAACGRAQAESPAKAAANGAAPPRVPTVVARDFAFQAPDLMGWMQSMQGPPPASALGGISGMERGQVQWFTHDFTPGTYVLICFLPDARDGKPHFMHGMMRTITVS